MEKIRRQIQPLIEKNMFQGKAIIIYGPRQVGKTTLVKAIQSKYQEKSVYLNCDEPDIREALIDKTSTELEHFIGDKKLVILDEAQRVKNIGVTVKLLVDNFSDMQIIATGSSSFDLSNKIVEPLTGRKYEFYLYPFSLEELQSLYSSLEIHRLLEQRIIYGSYPDIVIDSADRDNKLRELTRSYLYKDVLQYQKIRNGEILEKLLQAIALQIGNEVSYNELATAVGTDKNTIQQYIRILEQAFIIFRLQPFSRNLRNELKKLRKIYFYDTGIRNAVINNLNPLNLRNDTGALWENFMISERVKFNANHQLSKNIYFWRTHAKQEIDYLEEHRGELLAYEFKWQKKSYTTPKSFIDSYGVKASVVNKENYGSFVHLSK
ncbi:MAG TPA: ATP-binding protein [bacterium]|nr:ATP-binding protein [bacterium]